jgi:hypothetical protein
MPASPDARIPEGPVHPHPITPQHQRIFAENRLIGGLNGAMDVKDVPAMRRFLEQYRREYPEDNEMLQDGYAVIADCFEHPGAKTRAAAERWVQTHNGSTLKRFVNRHCLEPSPVVGPPAPTGKSGARRRSASSRRRSHTTSGRTPSARRAC